MTIQYRWVCSACGYEAKWFGLHKEEFPALPDSWGKVVAHDSRSSQYLPKFEGAICESCMEKIFNVPAADTTGSR